MSRKKFKVMYPKDHPDKNLAGTRFKQKWNEMVVMNEAGVFFLYNGEQYYPSIKRLSDVLPKYDVVWPGEDDGD